MDEVSMAVPSTIIPLVRARVDARSRDPTVRGHELDPLLRYLLARMCVSGTDVTGDDLLDRMFPPPVMAIGFAIGCGFVLVEPVVTIPTFEPPVVPGLRRPAAPPPPPLSWRSLTVVEEAMLDLLRSSHGELREELQALASWICGPGRAPVDLDRMFPPALVPRTRRVACGVVVLKDGRPVVTYVPPALP
jgi:hypothetical protein